MEMMRVCNEAESSLVDVADVIQTDPALSAEMIKYANSAFMSTDTPVTSTQKAAVKLGMKNLVSLAMGLSLLSKINKELDPDELFICALLCQMGQLALCSIFPEEYDNMLIESSVHASLSEKEYALFEIESSEMTIELFLDWELPAHLALATGFYQGLCTVELGSDITLRTAVYLKIADMMAEMCQSKEPLLEHIDSIFSIAESYQVEIGVFSETFGRVVSSWHDSGRLFDVATSECFSYAEE